MGFVDWIKHHWWWLAVFVAIAFERLLAALTSLDLISKLWGWLILPMPLSLPIGLALFVPIASLLAVTALGLKCFRFRSQLEALKNPASPELDSLQERVLFWIVKIYDSNSTGVGPTPAKVAETSGIQLSDVEAALDVLKQCQIVRRKKYKSNPIDLTAQGRTYVTQPGNKSRFALFHINSR